MSPDAPAPAGGRAGGFTGCPLHAAAPRPVAAAAGKGEGLGISEETLARLVDTFYARVRRDPWIGPVFNDAVADWDEHLEKLQAFWSSIMLTSGRYKGHPLAEHIKLGAAIERDMFQRWLALWRETTAELLAPGAAAAIQLKAERMAERLTMGIEMARGGPAGFAGAAA